MITEMDWINEKLFFFFKEGSVDSNVFDLHFWKGALISSVRSVADISDNLEPWAPPLPFNHTGAWPDRSMREDHWRFYASCCGRHALIGWYTSVLLIDGLLSAELPRRLQSNGKLDPWNFWTPAYFLCQAALLKRQIQLPLVFNRCTDTVLYHTHLETHDYDSSDWSDAPSEAKRFESSTPTQVRCVIRQIHCVA